MSIPKIRIPIIKWFFLLLLLKRKGAGRKESGAFLLGNKSEGKVKEYICYDELDEHCFDNGIIEFDGKGYVSLWKYCEKKNLSVLADVHTHPGDWIGQSMSDKTNPMVAQVGHVALIVPHYAKDLFQGLSKVGVYLYKGDHKWKTISTENGAVKLTLL